jgi:hypothetical protein
MRKMNGKVILAALAGIAIGAAGAAAIYARQAKTAPGYVIAEVKDWEDSPAYGAIRPIRQSSAKGRVSIVEGVTPA